MIILISHSFSYFHVLRSIRFESWKVRLVNAEIAPKLNKQRRLFKTIVIGERGRTQSELNLQKQRQENF